MNIHFAACFSRCTAFVTVSINTRIRAALLFLEKARIFKAKHLWIQYFVVDFGLIRIKSSFNRYYSIHLDRGETDSELNWESLCNWLTCSSCIVFSSNFVLKISFVIFSCNSSLNSSKCSGLKPGELISARGGAGVVVVVAVLLELVSFWSGFSSSSFGGTEITPRCERFRSFSRTSMNCCENLKMNERE